MKPPGLRVSSDVSFAGSSITISVPATSANLGPGYDCLGLAVDLHNTITVTRKEEAGESPEHGMIRQVADVFFAQPEVSEPAFGFTWQIEGDVPTSRGLGSSVTVRLGVMMGLNELAGAPLSRQRLFELCSEAEGHPDNVGPAVFGGFVLSNGTASFRFEVDERLKVVLVIPNHEVETLYARGALPAHVPHRDAARNTANACTIVAAFAMGRYEQMGDALQDYLHQPYRQHLIPGLFEAIEAGRKAGAIGGYLSGSGSTIACFATSSANTEAIAAAMQKALATKNIQSISHVVGVDNSGARVLN